MAVHSGLACLLLALTLSACALQSNTSEIRRIALLAPFEGRYREIGYDALYAARLALHDAQAAHIELLAVDDGGSAATASDRLRALQDDPLVTLVIGLGDVVAQAALSQPADQHLPLLLVGHWSASPANEAVWVLSNSAIGEIVSTPDTRLPVTALAALTPPLICPDICALKQFTQLTADFTAFTVISSSTLPPADFIERYQQSDPFAPPPGLLATLTYDALSIAIAATQTQTTRGQISDYLNATIFNGINGEIRFAAGYWATAPLHEYRYDANGQLTASPAD